MTAASGGLKDGRSAGRKRESSELSVEEAEYNVVNIFSLRKPKDIKAGIASGGKSAVKGILVGTVSLIAAPAVGAFSEGWIGLAKGFGIGLAGAILLPVTGIGIGLAQVVRGAVNTPEAIREALKGKHWDQDERIWIEAPTLALILDDELFAQTRERWHCDPANQASTSGREDAEDLYELFGVPRDASAEEIKRQYYIMARRMHPDKNPKDPRAKERFQRLGEAYQVLGNAERRQRYDAHGEKAVDGNFMDASEFFTMLFGSDKFEHLLGELVIAAAARNGGDFSLGQAKQLQAVRVARLAVILAALLRRWVEGDEVGFQESTREEGEMLASTSYGAKILRILGRAYELQADVYMGGLIDGSVANVRSRVQTLRSQMSAAGMAVKVLHTQQKMESFERREKAEKKLTASNGPSQKSQRASGESTPQEEERIPTESEAKRRMELMQLKQQLEEDALPIMLDAIWAMNVLDIEATAKAVCRQALTDPSVDKRVRKQRSQALKAMGQIFQDRADRVLQKEEQPDEKDKARRAKQQMEDAMHRVVAKRHAMDDAMHSA